MAFAFLRSGVAKGVGPLEQCGLDEALGLAVGPRRIGPRTAMADAQPSAGLTERPGVKAGPVVGQDAPDGDAQDRVVAHGRLQMRDRILGPLGGMDLAVGDARAIIDRHMHVLVAGADGVLGANPGHTVPRVTEARQLLDVEMEQIAGVFVLVAPGWLDGPQRTQAVPSLTPQAPADARPRDPRESGDPIHGPALAPQGDDLPVDGLRGSERLSPRPRRAVHKTRTARLLEPLDPALPRLWIHATGAGRGSKAQSVIDDQADHPLSTAGTHEGILMRVHGTSSSGF